MDVPTVTITPESSEQNYWTEVWRHRELAAFLAWRDLVVRYKQTIVGVAWTIIRPLAMILVYSFAFGYVAQLPSQGIPYTLLVLTGMLPWQLFSLVLIVSSESLLANSQLVQKVYFPRFILPISSIAVCIVDHLIAFVLIGLMLIWFGVTPGPQIILLPFVTLLAVGCALGLGLLAAALNTKYRDLRQVIPIALQVGVFLCPVAYATSLMPERWLWLYALNPMVGVIDAFRWCILGKSDLIYPPSIIVSIVFATGMLIFATHVFRKMEPEFPDMM